MGAALPGSASLVSLFKELQVPVEGEHPVGLSPRRLPEDPDLLQCVRQRIGRRLGELCDLADPLHISINSYPYFLATLL